jgi:putative ATPase
VDQHYLPDELRDRRWYEPSDHGAEASVAARLDRIRSDRSSEEPPS